MITLDTQDPVFTAAPTSPRCASRIAYRVGDISFGMFCDGDVLLKFDSALLDFAASAECCDVHTQVVLADRLSFPACTPLFVSGGTWSLIEDAGGYRFTFLKPSSGEAPYKTAWYDREFKIGHVTLSREFFRDGESVYPLEYPLDELLMIHRLACGQGVEVHAVGMVDEAGRGRLFLGHSGAGKSTTARLWTSQPGLHILSDDRIVLRVRDDGRVWMFGTPWHGDAGIASSGSAPLDVIYFLEQWHTNEIIPLPRDGVAAELFARSFVPRHDAKSLDFTLGFLERVARQVPCNTFRFLPNQTAVETIRHARD
jgi:hypothetical protein